MIGEKIARTMRLGLAVLAGCVLMSTAAHADVDVFNAKIVRVGPDPRFAGPMVQLIDEGPSPQWVGVKQFYLSATLGNAGFATMLTAMSLGQNVFVRIAGTGEEGSLITIIFLNAPAS